MGVRLLIVAWAIAIAVIAGTAGWLALADPPVAEHPTLVLALPGIPDPEPVPAAPPPEAAAPETVSPDPVTVPVPATDSPPAARPEPPPQTTADPTGDATGAPPGEPTAAESAAGLPSIAESPATDPVPAVASDAPVSAPAPIEAAHLHPALAPAALPPPSSGEPWLANARPFSSTDRPRIAVVISDLGLGAEASRAAIERMPADVTLAFAPYVDEVAEWVERARADGHEVLLTIPMEPATFPQDDPGPKALLTSVDAMQNLQRLSWALGRAEGYVGVISAMGSRFLTSEEHLRPVLALLRERGLLFVDGGTTPRSVASTLSADLQVPRAVNDRFIDAEPSRAGIDRRLAEVERIARETGAALAVGRPYPVTLDRIVDWAATLPDRGFALAPVSAVVNRQAPP